MAKIEGYRPSYLENADSRSYRSIYKWGNPNKFYAPSPRSRMYEYVRDALMLSDDYFKEPNYANEQVKVDKVSTALDNKDVDYLRNLVGEGNVYIDLDTRIRSSITKCNEEYIAMHKGLLPPIVDAVVCPCSEAEIVDILTYAKKRKIKVVMHSALLPKVCEKKTIAIDLTRRYNKITDFNEVDSNITVEAGMYMPILENIMNNAPDNFKDYHIESKYTIGHFPLEYEECTILDCATKYKIGSESAFYGSFDDIMLEKEYLTTEGKVSEYVDGAILSKVKLKIRKYFPHNRYGFTFMFHTWQEAVNAMREVYANNIALPVRLRLSDAKETSLLMRYYMLDDSPVDGYLKMRKCEDDKRCLMVGFSGGSYSYSRLAFNTIRRIAKKYRAINLTSILADAYNDSRFNEMYLREMGYDFGISATSEFHTLNWSELPDAHKELTSSIESGHIRSHIVSANMSGVVLEVVKMKI